MPGMYSKYDAQETMKSLKQVGDLFKKTKLDPSFQRNGGWSNGSGWTVKEGRNYLENLVTGGTFNFILVVDLKKAYEYAIENRDKKSAAYFGGIAEKGYEYLSIDGNNSSSFIYEFINDNEEVTLRGQRISEYSDEERETYKYEEKVKFIVLRTISSDECAKLFRDLNTASALNPQEHRQARFSALSGFIRDVSNTPATRGMFTNLIYTNTDNLDKRFHEEMVAQLCLKLEESYDIDLKKKNLDHCYNDNEELKKETERDVKHILKQAALCSDKAANKTKIVKGVLHNLFTAIDCVDDADLTIIDHEKFISWFLGKDGFFRVKSGNISEKDQESESYTYWTKYFGNKDNYLKIQYLFIATLEDEKSELIKNGTLTPKRKARGSGNRFNLNQKLELWDKQGHKTREGKNIDILDIYRGDYEADHVISVANGGGTTIENGELMSREENRKKGSKNNEAHFDFQKGGHQLELTVIPKTVQNG